MSLPRPPDPTTLELDLPPGQPLLVAFSGGLDSTVLLHALASDGDRRAAGLRAIHVHHGLHPDADRWALHCAEFCRQWQVPLVQVRVVVPTGTGLGLEAAAREARYAAFATQLREGECLLLAHHRDDQAETVLQRLLRGAGGAGLAAMRRRRPFAAGSLWRPMLALPRTAILDYARDHGLSWLEDPANADLRHDRNFLRHRLLPLLRERWPQADAALAHSARWLAEESELLAGEAGRRLAQVQGLDPDTLSVPGLLALSPAWRRQVLRAWLAQRGRPALPGPAYATWEGNLLRPEAGDGAELRWSDATMRRWRDLLYLDSPETPGPGDWELDWRADAPLPLPTGDRLEFGDGAVTAAIASLGPFRVCSRRGGERIALPGRRHSHELKHVLQDLGIPPWTRRRLPLLFAADGELLAAADLAISARLQAACASDGRRLHWRRGEGPARD